MANIRGRNKTGLDHVAHEQVANLLGIFLVSFISLLRFCVLGMGKSHPAALFQDVEHRNPILSGRFHADLRAFILGKPIGQLL